jgi:hypothetical protein
MTQFIKAQSVGAVRNQYLKSLALSIRVLANKKEIDEDTKDIIAFIILLLDRMDETIETTTTAWEKRDYWIKADQFRLEWEWCQKHSTLLKNALLKNDWHLISSSLPLLAAKCQKINLSSKLLKTTPWMGAYVQLKKELS